MKRLLAAAAIILGVIGPAYSGSKGDKTNVLQEKEDERLKKENKDVDKAYNDMMKRTRTNAKPYDPWQTVRPPNASADKK
jgi:hypothetical protein